MRQPCPCRHIRAGMQNDGTGLCTQCKITPIPKDNPKVRKAKGLQTGPR